MTKQEQVQEQPDRHPALVDGNRIQMRLGSPSESDGIHVVNTVMYTDHFHDREDERDSRPPSNPTFEVEELERMYINFGEGRGSATGTGSTGRKSIRPATFEEMVQLLDAAQVDLLEEGTLLGSMRTYVNKQAEQVRAALGRLEELNATDPSRWTSV